MAALPVCDETASQTGLKQLLAAGVVQQTGE